jgi:hypothetical protein
VSNESGRFEVYVQPFPGPGDRERLSTNGGAQVRWRHDGQELFYIALGAAHGGADPVRARCTSAQSRRTGGAFQDEDRRRTATSGEFPIIVSRDGQRFLMNTLVDDTSSAPITLILNWKPKE